MMGWTSLIGAGLMMVGAMSVLLMGLWTILARTSVVSIAGRRSEVGRPRSRRASASSGS